MADPVVGIAIVKPTKGARRAIPTRAVLVLLPAAVNKIKELMEARPDSIGLKVGVKQGGCNGLSYILDYALEKGKMDEEVFQDGARVLIEPKAQLTLLGTEMDYVETQLSPEFVFINPNVKVTCGSGQRFSV